MSALPSSPVAALRPMREADVDAVFDVECRRLLRALIQLARTRGAQRIFLEVRPSNRRAIALYDMEGFNEIGRRPRYYPARDGREDAIVMAMELLPAEI